MTCIPKEDYSKIQAVLPILCVDCLIIYQKRCLLLLRLREPAKGQYWFPGGRVLKGELIRDASVRKACEETNLNCSYEKIITIEETIFKQCRDMPFDMHTVNICCQLSVIKYHNLVLDETHSSYIWIDLEQAADLDLHPSVSIPIRKCLNNI